MFQTPSPLLQLAFPRHWLRECFQLVRSQFNFISSLIEEDVTRSHTVRNWQLILNCNLCRRKKINKIWRQILWSPTVFIQYNVRSRTNFRLEKFTQRGFNSPKTQRDFNLRLSSTTNFPRRLEAYLV